MLFWKKKYDFSQKVFTIPVWSGVLIRPIWAWFEPTLLLTRDDSSVNTSDFLIIVPAGAGAGASVLVVTYYDAAINNAIGWNLRQHQKNIDAEQQRTQLNYLSILYFEILYIYRFSCEESSIIDDNVIANHTTCCSTFCSYSRDNCVTTGVKIYFIADIEILVITCDCTRIILPNHHAPIIW